MPLGERNEPFSSGEGDALTAWIAAYPKVTQSLGPAADWPRTLTAAVVRLLNAPQPLWLVWGDDLLLFYNRAGAPLLGGRDPDAQGAPLAEALPEAWSVLGAALAGLRGTSGGVIPDLPVPDIAGPEPRERFVTLTCSPAAGPRDGEHGFFCAPSDVTRGVVEARRSALIRALAVGTAKAADLDTACAALSAAFASDPADIPFAALYLLQDGMMIRRAEAGPLPQAFFAQGPLRSDCPVRQVMHAGHPEVIDLPPYAVQDNGGSSAPTVRRAMLIPIIAQDHGRPHGVLVFGMCPARAAIAGHREFLNLLGVMAETAIERGAAAQTELRRTRRELDEAQERIEMALAAGAIVGTWIWHPQADIMTADERFARAFGLDPAECHSGISINVAVTSIHPDDRDLVGANIEEAMKRGGDYRAEYRVRHASGAYRWVEAAGHCELDGQGKPLRFPGVLIDIEQRREIESTLRRREADLALLLDATADGFYAVDRDGFTTRCNASFLRMLGFEHEKDVVGRQLHDIIHHSHPDGRHYPHEDCPIYHVARTGEMAHVDDEVFFRKDGTSFPVEYWARPVIWQGELQGAVCNILDISERKRGEESRQLLLRELNHRVKNLFSITGSMIQMTARHSRNVEEMASALRGRLISLSRAHELITTSIETCQDPEAPAALGQLIEKVMEPHATVSRATLELDGPKVPIGASATTSLALILHELATNAVKYGALGAPEGLVRIGWRLQDDMLVLTWSETGGPQIAGAPDHSGFGSQLARLSATGQLAGSIAYDWRPEGVAIELRAAIQRIAL